jgi:hypothetical protein
MVKRCSPSPKRAYFFDVVSGLITSVYPIQKEQ